MQGPVGDGVPGVRALWSGRCPVTAQLHAGRIQLPACCLPSLRPRQPTDPGCCSRSSTRGPCCTCAAAAGRAALPLHHALTWCGPRLGCRGTGGSPCTATWLHQHLPTLYVQALEYSCTRHSAEHKPVQAQRVQPAVCTESCTGVQLHPSKAFSTAVGFLAQGTSTNLVTLPDLIFIHFWW